LVLLFSKITGALIHSPETGVGTLLQPPDSKYH